MTTGPQWQPSTPEELQTQSSEVPSGNSGGLPCPTTSNWKSGTSQEPRLSLLTHSAEPPPPPQLPPSSPSLPRQPRSQKVNHRLRHCSRLSPSNSVLNSDSYTNLWVLMSRLILSVYLQRFSTGGPQRSSQTQKEGRL